MKNLTHKQISHRTLRQGLEERYAKLTETEYGGNRYIDEVNFLETVLADEVEQSESPSEKKERIKVEASLQKLARRIREKENTDRGGASRPDGGASPFPPEHVLEDAPSSPIPSPRCGGYDGQTAVGFEGCWDENKFKELLEQLDAAKEQSWEAGQAIVTTLAGQEIIIEQSGSKGTFYYKYCIHWDGVTLYIHHNPVSKKIQPVRVVYGAEILMTNTLFAVHTHVLEFLSSLGFQKTSEKISRLDAQVMLDVPVSTFACLILDQHLITKFRKNRSYDLLNGKPNDLTFGSKENVEICIYDKRKELNKHRDFAKAQLFIEHCIGRDWYNDIDRPVTRVEIRLGRDALRSLGINTIDDLREREQATYDLITRDWFRILASSKVRGTENHAGLHDVWKRVRALFRQYFSGDEVQEVEWRKPTVESCNVSASEKQAIGNLAVAIAYKCGKVDLKQVFRYGEGLFLRYFRELAEKVNDIVERVRIRQGIMIAGDDTFLFGYVPRFREPPELRLRR